MAEDGTKIEMVNESNEKVVLDIDLNIWRAPTDNDRNGDKNND